VAESIRAALRRGKNNSEPSIEKLSQ
jgi:hypothetical protein